jgi:hypothetical protein
MPAPYEGVDYSDTTSLGNEQCFVNNLKQFVCRYYDNSGGSSSKILDAAEVASLHSAPLKINVVYETCGGVCTGSCTGSPCGIAYFTPSQGTYDAQQALGAAQRAGQPSGTPIYFAVDYDASASEFTVLVEYFNAVYNVLNPTYKVGLYGSFALCEYAGANWPGVPYRWQAVGWNPGGTRSLYAQIWQNGGQATLCTVLCDFDRQFDESAW